MAAKQQPTYSPETGLDLSGYTDINGNEIISLRLEESWSLPLKVGTVFKYEGHCVGVIMGNGASQRISFANGKKLHSDAHRWLRVKEVR